MASCPVLSCSAPACMTVHLPVCLARVLRLAACSRESPANINECENETLNKCPNKSDCVNTQGSYNCNKPKSPVKIAITGIGFLIIGTDAHCLRSVSKPIVVRFFAAV
uniref:NOTCH1 EGF-like calcium-binding domain-containing protein n=1 Tax=Quercus lobata TaxID=97700 RepID=A0A7N2LP96_QUELO